MGRRSHSTPRIPRTLASLSYRYLLVYAIDNTQEFEDFISDGETKEEEIKTSEAMTQGMNFTLTPTDVRQFLDPLDAVGPVPSIDSCER